MKQLKNLGFIATGVLMATQAHAKPPFLTELSYQKEVLSRLAVQLSQQEGERRLDKYRPYLGNTLQADTEIAAFEEVKHVPQNVPRNKGRVYRRDRIQ